MDPGIRAAREQQARESIAASVESLAKKHDVDLAILDGFNNLHRDPRLRGLFQLEALVPILKTLDEAPEPSALPEHGLTRPQVAEIILTIPDLTKTSQKAINTWANREHTPDRAEIAEIALSIPGLTKTSQAAIEAWAEEEDQVDPGSEAEARTETKPEGEAEAE